MSNMRIRALETTLKAVIFEASKNTKLVIFSILISYKYHNDNIIHIYSSTLLLNMTIILISMIHILPYIIYLRLLVKILLPVTDLNMVYKTHKTSKNTRNSDFRKIVKSGFRAISPVLARHTSSSSSYLLFYHTTIDSNNLNPPPPRYTQFRPRQPSRDSL